MTLKTWRGARPVFDVLNTLKNITKIKISRRAESFIAALDAFTRHGLGELIKMNRSDEEVSAQSATDLPCQGELRRNYISEVFWQSGSLGKICVFQRYDCAQE